MCTTSPRAHQKALRQVTRSVSENQARLDTLSATLTQRVRFLTLAQIERTFFADSSPERARATTRRFLQRQEANGTLVRSSLLAHPELPLTEPVMRWAPGDPAPDFADAASRCRTRWRLMPERVNVWSASVATAQRRGGFGGTIPRPHQATHNLHVGTLYCHLLQHAPDLAAAWVPEECLPLGDPGERMPDAVLFDTDERPFYAYEFGGSCRTERVIKLHAFGMRYQIPYELW